MADYDEFDDDEKFDYGSLPLENQQEFLYELIGFDADPGDVTAHELFWEVMYNDELTQSERDALYEQLQDYLYDEYGMYFDDVWDWEDFREWYEGGERK